MTVPALTDSSVLINFARVRQPELLQQAFDRLFVPHAVITELEEGEAVGHIPVFDWEWLPVIHLDPAEHARAQAFAQRLGAGESACLAIAEARGWMILTDDLDARRMAASLGIRVSGTLGALSNLITASVLTLEQGDALLAELKQHGYYSPVNSLKELGIGE